MDNHTEETTEFQGSGSSTYGIVVPPMATAAALDSSAFSGINATDAIPATWEDRARKAWEYYTEEPLVKNCVNSWRTFAVGDEIKIKSDDDTVKDEANALADRIGVSDFVKDMVLQLLVKGDAVGFRRYTKDLRDIEEVTCVNPVSVRVKYGQGQLVEVRQFPEDMPTAGDGLDLPVEQTIHLKWDAPEFSQRGNSLVLPAFQSIELLRDYRKAEQAIAKRWATPFRLLKVGGAFGQKMVMPDQRMLEQVRDMVNKMDMKSGLVVPFYVTVETLRYIREVEKIPDDDYVALLRPYVEGRFGSDAAKKRAFYDQALSRKHGLRTDFEGFYSDVLRRPGFRFEDATPEKVAVGRLGKAEEAVIEDVQKLGWQGKCLPIDETDVEDQNALIFTEKVGSSERTVIKLKLRPEAQPAVLEKLRQAERQMVRVGEPLPEDDFSGDILAAVKTINHHAQDGSYNQGTLEKAKKHLPVLRRLSASDDPDVKEMADSYIGWLTKIEEGASKRQGIPETFSPYLKKHVSDVKRKGGADFTTRKTKVLLTKRSIRSGELGVESEASDITTMFGRRPMPDGEQYEIDFGEGVKAVYRPWGSKNLYAHSGEFEMVLPERPDAKSVDRALERMEQIGIKASVAGPEDAEIMYLHKQAYVTKLDRDPEYLRMVSGLDSRNASKTERVQAMRGCWEKLLGVRDITKTPGYDPIGEYQLGFRDRSLQGGYRHQYRFDISDEKLERDMAGYSLYHSLTNDSSMSGFLDTVLGNNGAMVSTVEKLRSGVTPGGMSPEEDMRSGGASYVFTRIKKSPVAGGDRSPGVYLKKRLLRRMDAISYDHDAYGKVIDDYVTQHRGFSPTEWKRFSKKTGNETILKYSVTLLDNLEHIVVGSATEKNKVLGVFRSHGVSILPDGRKIEEVVLTR